VPGPPPSAARRSQAVGDGDDEGDGDVLREGEGEGEADFEGLGEGDFDGLDEGDFDGLSDGDGWTWNDAGAEDRMMIEDGLSVADTAGVAATGTAAGLREAFPALVRAAWACAAEEPVGWTVAVCAGCGRAKMNSVTPTAATAHTATAVVASATPGLARMLFQLSRLTACANPATHVDSARRTTRRR
jgi:hypothetical protein